MGHPSLMFHGHQVSLSVIYPDSSASSANIPPCEQLLAAVEGALEGVGVEPGFAFMLGAGFG
jgi:hypothetical protein